MLRSTLALVLAAGSTLVGTACTTNSDSAHVVTAPVTSVTPAAPHEAPPVAVAPSSSGGGDLASEPGPAADADAGAAAFQACQSDSDCVAVPRNGCCHNGWKEAVNVSQQDAYRQSFTCPQPHPICPMYIVRDTRVPRCDPAAHLCKMVQP
jgi:hypothetical protein